jgi:hypothetical protein
VVADTGQMHPRGQSLGNQNIGAWRVSTAYTSGGPSVRSRRTRTEPAKRRILAEVPQSEAFFPVVRWRRLTREQMLRIVRTDRSSMTNAERMLSGLESGFGDQCVDPVVAIGNLIIKERERALGASGNHVVSALEDENERVDAVVHGVGDHRILELGARGVHRGTGGDEIRDRAL